MVDGEDEVEIKKSKELALKNTKGADIQRFIRSQAPEFGIRIVYMTASLVCETKATIPVCETRVLSTTIKVLTTKSEYDYYLKLDKKLSKKQ